MSPAHPCVLMLPRHGTGHGMKKSFKCHSSHSLRLSPPPGLGITCPPSIPTLGSQRHVGVCEFQPSLVYITSSWKNRDAVKPCLPINRNKTNKPTKASAVIPVGPQDSGASRLSGVWGQCEFNDGIMASKCNRVWPWLKKRIKKWNKTKEEDVRSSFRLFFL